MVGYDCISVHPPTLPTKAYIHARTQVWKTSPFRGLGGVFIRCIGSSTHFVKTRIIVSDLREISVHIVRATYSTNRLYVLAKGKPGWKHVDTCKICTLFFTFSWTYASKITPFSWFRKFRPSIKKIPSFSRKWVRAWMYALVTSGGVESVKGSKDSWTSFRVYVIYIPLHIDVYDPIVRMINKLK